MRFDGQIDGRGMVTGRLTSFCGYQMVWQKEGQVSLIRRGGSFGA
jgi:hypothetical protein